MLQTVVVTAATAVVTVTVLVGDCVTDTVKVTGPGVRLLSCAVQYLEAAAADFLKHFSVLSRVRQIWGSHRCALLILSAEPTTS